MNSFFIALCKREMLLVARNLSEWIMPLVFFLLVVMIFPLAVSPAAEVLRNIAPGVIWTVALLSALLSQENLFKEDVADGSLEQILLTPQPLIIATFSKMITHWLAYGLPLVILAPLLGMWMHMPLNELATLLMTLPFGTGIFSLFSVFSAALLAEVQGHNFLGALIALPLCLPSIIFATAAISSDNFAPFLLLVAFFTLSLTILPLVTTSVLQQNVAGY